MYFATTMLMVSVCLMMNVITTNLYARKDSAYGPPMWLVCALSLQYSKWVAIEMKLIILRSAVGMTHSLRSDL